MQINPLGQPVGHAVPGWSPRQPPTARELAGRYCRLERLDPERHAEALFAADRHDVRGESWTYLPYGPFTELGAYREWVREAGRGADPRFYAIIDLDTGTGSAAGVASYLRIQPDAGSIEVGHVHFSPLLQRRRAATEAQFVLMRHAFEDLGYRRYEWKCDALNEPSRRAAARLGFTYEGRFRNHVVYKSRSRDSDWFSITDAEWPALAPVFEKWLDPANFVDGVQQSPLRF